MTPAETLDAIAIARRIGLPIPEAWQAETAETLARLLDQAALVMAAEIPPRHDPLPDFEP